MQQDWNRSFGALLIALESLVEKTKLNIQPDLSIIQLPTRKRKHSFSDQPRKSQNIGQLSSRFAKNVTIHSSSFHDNQLLSNDQNMTDYSQLINVTDWNHLAVNLPDSLKSHILKMKHLSSLTMDQVMVEWDNRKSQLISNINLINTMPNDSYDDLKIIVENIMESAHWLCGNGFDELKYVVQEWKYSEHKLSNIIRFIRIIEDMKSNEIPKLTRDLFIDIETIHSFIQSKQVLFGDMLRENCLAWRVLGFPVDDIGTVLQGYSDKVYRLVWDHLSNVNDAIGSLEESFISWEKPLSVLLQSIQCASDLHHLLGATSSISISVRNACTQLATIYITKTLNLIRNLFSPYTPRHQSRFPDAKVCHIYENLIQLLQCVSSYSISETINVEPILSNSTSTSSFGFSETSGHVQQSTKRIAIPSINLPTDLYHPVIEAGLELCTYASKPRPTDGGLQQLILSLCFKFTKSLSMIMEPVLQIEHINHVQLLIPDHISQIDK
ncbi:hypothetical protein BC833DRAFT_580872 [Globomyces pollinis-pini]|nr:hypothetical protein BC833DRAFT_580872 [Globomyces pollinis-pini]